MSRLSGQVQTDELASLQGIKQSPEDSPAGETRREAAGWYPNAYGWARLQYWDGERWTQRYRTIGGEEQESGEEQDAGEEEERSEESSAVQAKPILEAHGLFWQPTRVIVSVPREPVRLNPVGIGLAFIGAALMIIGAFLTRVESPQFFRVPDNTLIQSGDGWIFIALAIFIAVAVYAAIRGQRRTYAVLILAVLGIGVAIFNGTGDRLELSSLNPAAAAVLGSTQKTSPGTGLYAVGAGSGLAAFGGLLLTGIGSWAGTPLASWAGRLWTDVKDRWRIGEAASEQTET
jgi:hypothetical protein